MEKEISQWWSGRSDVQIKKIYKIIRASPYGDMIDKKLLEHGPFKNYRAIKRYIWKVKIKEFHKTRHEIPWDFSRGQP